MIATKAIRQGHLARTRSVLAAFVVCLNLVIQPCAMALGEMDEHDCPRCPPSHGNEHSQHAMHGHHTVVDEAAPGDMPCATKASDCSLVDEINFDGRSVKLEPKDTPTDSPIAIQSASVFEPTLRPAQRTCHGSRSPPPPSVPLNVYYCVYLK